MVFKANMEATRFGDADLRRVEFYNGYSTGTRYGRPFVEVSGPRARLRGADLSFADIRGTMLGLADLRKTTLSGAKATAANLTRALLEGADLEMADLSGALLVDADPRRANLRGTRLCGAKTSGANFAGAVYAGRARWPAGVDPRAVGARRFRAPAGISDKGLVLEGGRSRLPRCSSVACVCRRRVVGVARAAAPRRTIGNLAGGDMA
jgi:hypothetical protein